MKENMEYQIYIGCNDSQLRDELVSENELKEMVVSFFKKYEVDFSMYSAKGGYLHEDGSFVSENSLCVNIVGARDLDIIRLAKSLSMFMNQECSLIVKDEIKTEFM